MGAAGDEIGRRSAIRSFHGRPLPSRNQTPPLAAGKISAGLYHGASSARASRRHEFIVNFDNEIIPAQARTNGSFHMERLHHLRTHFRTHRAFRSGALFARSLP